MKVYGWIAVAVWLVQAQQESPPEVHVSEGQTVELKCPHVSALPVRWQKYQSGTVVSLLDHNEDGHFSLAADNRSLTVQRARAEHGGLYLCQSRIAAYLAVDPLQPGASVEDVTEDTTTPTTTPLLGTANYWMFRVAVAVAVGMAVGVALKATLVLLNQRKNRSRKTLQNHRSNPTPDPVATSDPTSDVVYEEMPDRGDVL